MQISEWSFATLILLNKSTHLTGSLELQCSAYYIPSIAISSSSRLQEGWVHLAPACIYVTTCSISVWSCHLFDHLSFGKTG